MELRRIFDETERTRTLKSRRSVWIWRREDRSIHSIAQGGRVLRKKKHRIIKWIGKQESLAHGSSSWWCWRWTRRWRATRWCSVLPWSCSTGRSRSLYSTQRDFSIRRSSVFLPKPSCTEAIGTACRDDVRDCWDIELRTELDRMLDGVLAMLDKSSKWDWREKKGSKVTFRRSWRAIVLVLSAYCSNVSHRDRWQQFGQWVRRVSCWILSELAVRNRALRSRVRLDYVLFVPLAYWR